MIKTHTLYGRHCFASPLRQFKAQFPYMFAIRENGYTTTVSLVGETTTTPCQTSSHI